MVNLVKGGLWARKRSKGNQTRRKRKIDYMLLKDATKVLYLSSASSMLYLFAYERKVEDGQDEQMASAQFQAAFMSFSCLAQL